jgi:tetratricopeptide (TPR) repeat protein
VGDLIFISHAVEDKPVGESICEKLENAGWKCWIAPRDILPGSDWGEAIVEAINLSRLMILVYSDSAGRSVQIKREVERAVSKNVTIIPFRVEDVSVSKSLEYYLATAYWIDALSFPISPHLNLLTEMTSRLIGPPKAEALATGMASCSQCGIAMEPWEEKCQKCGHTRELSPAAKVAFSKRRVPRRWSGLWPRSRMGKIFNVSVAVVILALGLYFGFRQWRGTSGTTYEGHLNAAGTHLAKGEYDLAIAEITKAIESDPLNWLGYRQRGIAYFQRGSFRTVSEDFVRALSDLQRATSLNPEDDYAHYMLGRTYYSQAKYDDALREFDAAIKINGDVGELRKWRGHVSYRLKEYDVAIDNYTKAHELSPRDPEILLSRGFTYVENGQYAAAKSDFESARDINPSNPDAYKGLSEVSRKLGKTSDAIDYDQQANSLYQGRPIGAPTP